MKHSMTDIIKNNLAKFSHYRTGIMYYYIEVSDGTSVSKYTFPVYLNDIAEATLHSEEKAIMLMRYVRRAINDGTITCVDL